MILDSGICTVFRREDTAEPGGMPEYKYAVLTQAWFGMLAFETAPRTQGGSRENTEISARIRIQQNLRISNHNVVVLRQTATLPEDCPRYDVTRAYHGTDDDNGQPITDLTLLEVEQ